MKIKNLLRVVIGIGIGVTISVTFNFIQNNNIVNYYLTEQLKEANVETPDNSTNGKTDKEEVENKESKIVWLEELTPLSSIETFVDGKVYEVKVDKWETENLDNGGKTYQHGVYIKVNEYFQNFSECEVQYALNGQFDKFKGKIVLSEIGKNNVEGARVRIYKDDSEEILYETGNEVKAGFNGDEFAFSVKDVEKIRIVLEQTDTEGFSGRDFGIVNARFSS